MRHDEFDRWFRGLFFLVKKLGVLSGKFPLDATSTSCFARASKNELGGDF